MSLGLDSIINRARLRAVSKRVIYGGKLGEELAKQAGLMPMPIQEAADVDGVRYFVQGYHSSEDDVIIP